MENSEVISLYPYKITLYIYLQNEEVWNVDHRNIYQNETCRTRRKERAYNRDTWRELQEQTRHDSPTSSVPSWNYPEQYFTSQVNP